MVRKRLPPNSSSANTYSGEIPSISNDESIHDSPTQETVQPPKVSEKPATIAHPRNLSKYLWRSVQALVIILFVPPFLNYVALKREATELKPQGELYDIGWNVKLHMACQGKGLPTVILESPTGYSSDIWSLLVPILSKHTKVCTYDRAGLGFSDRPIEGNYTSNLGYEPTHGQPGQPFTVERMAEDLRKLFTVSSQVPKPFLFVGSEIGALIVQFYTQLYTEDVAGLVLLNPLTENLFLQDSGIWLTYWFNHLVPSFQTLHLAASLGFARIGLMLHLIKPPLQSTDFEDKMLNRQKHLICHPRHVSSIVDEHFFINDSFSQMRSVRIIKSLPSNLPVMVMTGNYYDEQLPSHLNKAWAKSEQTLISQFIPHAKHIVINGGDRHMIYKKPIAVAQRIINVIKQYKSTKS